MSGLIMVLRDVESTSKQANHALTSQPVDETSLFKPLSFFCIIKEIDMANMTQKHFNLLSDSFVEGFEVELRRAALLSDNIADRTMIRHGIETVVQTLANKLRYTTDDFNQTEFCAAICTKLVKVQHADVRRERAEEEIKNSCP
jgi:hypothetical protein